MEGSKKEEKDVKQRVVLYKWQSPMRPFQKLDKKKFWSISLAVLALFVVLAILGQYGLMLAIASVMFLFYVLGTVPPDKIDHVITSLGIETLNKPYEWDFLRSYWFVKKDEYKVLNVETSMAFPSRLIMLVNEEDFKKVHSILKEKLPYKDLRDQRNLDKITEGEWINLLEDEKSAK